MNRETKDFWQPIIITTIACASLVACMLFATKCEQSRYEAGDRRSVAERMNHSTIFDFKVETPKETQQ